MVVLAWGMMDEKERLLLIVTDKGFSFGIEEKRELLLLILENGELRKKEVRERGERHF